ncbi:hypothetical protein CHH28_18620 [Bacterioplanes sanyensis]|uniref:2Fe-2S ferredoxin-type domain-containing protein n=1 Tax=Bacterioplanes sanyensis TaxID=1249553 RepID=A0A222FNE8_9GAMM|nr:hypothetical protein CHH28_18620 [Bacterioplanes sanyensis]
MPLVKDNNGPEAFDLDGQPQQTQPEFELEPEQADSEPAPAQAELYLPDHNPEQPGDTPQLPLSPELLPPKHAVQLADGRAILFQHAGSLLESMEAQDIDVHYQCRDGYCGSCRVQLLEGNVHYSKEPLAFIDDGEILPCCCIPTSALKIKL